MANVSWWKIRDQSLALAARQAGFDLSIYDQYSEQTRNELKAAAIIYAMNNIRSAFEGVAARKLSEIKQGVYVICLSHPFTIKYAKTCSEIVYIGRGNINGRLKSHFEKSLFRLMRGLSGTNFDFYLTEPVHTASDAYFKHIEYLLLKRFSDTIGGGKLPILNTNAGSKQDIVTVGAGWEKPLKATGKKPLWALETTKHWDFEKLG